MTGTRVLRASAPGKLFLIGEYAVLEGAPAVLAAVDRRARVELRAARDGRWRLDAPNLGLHDLDLSDPATVASPVLHERLKVFLAVREHVGQHLGAILPPLHVHIDTAEFARDGHKLGLGSSAAVATALYCALLAWQDVDTEPAELARLAIAAHRNAQNGTGSGGDVATSVYGGMIRYSSGQTPQILRWPNGLSGLAVVTGQGANTPDLVRRVYAYEENAPQGFAADLARLCALAEMAADHIDRAGRFLQLAREYFEALIALDHHASAGIVSARHHELHALAARHGAVFKSSGAGGGDVGLLFATPHVDETALHAAFAGVGAEVVTLQMGATGVRLDSA